EPGTSLPTKSPKRIHLEVRRAGGPLLRGFQGSGYGPAKSGCCPALALPNTIALMNVTRRDLGRLALAALPVAKLLAKPTSKFGGVQVGINAPYSFRGLPGKAEDILKYMLQLGLNGIELRSQPVEGWLGAPVAPPPPGRNQPPQTPEQEAA